MKVIIYKRDEMAKRLGLSISQFHFYIRAGKLPKPERYIINNRPKYDSEYEEKAQRMLCTISH